MNRGSRGFTLIEVLVVVVIGTILTSIAVKGFGMVSAQASAREARNVFVGMVARTRAQAVESGQTTILFADARGDSVMILAGGRIMENVRFGEEMGVDLRGTQDVTRICMSPRGYADTGCNSFNSAVELAFVQGQKSESVAILPMGQIQW